MLSQHIAVLCRHLLSRKDKWNQNSCYVFAMGRVACTVSFCAAMKSQHLVYITMFVPLCSNFKAVS